MNQLERCLERSVWWMHEASAADTRAIEYQRDGLYALAVHACKQVVLARTNYNYWINQAERYL